MSVDVGDAWDLNGDGRFSYKKSVNWWGYGNGQPVRIRDASYLRTLRTSKDYVDMNTSIFKYNAMVLWVDDYKVHGQVQINPNNGHIYGAAWYDFEKYTNSPLRNWATRLGAEETGIGERYQIFYEYPND